ncbi:type I polyketide synthase, partial [Nocardia sp. NPDC051570]|uniref:type I polyketide synthase n=1 Tax=Nocardia sp. NPDC051570 TaxID=3364324 RepID=UPI0037AD1FA7
MDASVEEIIEALRESMLENERLRDQQARLATSIDEPIAIIAMSCRYPGGVDTPEKLWQLVDAGVDAMGGFPEDRDWDLDNLFDPDPNAPGKTHVDRGGFIDGAANFDAAFFGINPREALAMDPQQRLLLEVSWEAVERAGIDPKSLRGSRTGVFAGLIYHDYGTWPAAAPEGVEGYLGNGTLGSIATGRIAYVLGLEGPAVTIDTACSASLVAIHLAARALRAGECTLALAGGVTIMSTPDAFVDFSRQGGLSADGRCKSFASGADGTGWGEGAGILMLEKLSDAQRNGRRILAVVRGSAINSDGASNGLTAPNGPSQERVIAAALANARLTPEQIQLVEAHGTGTPLGDPIEAQALLNTYGRNRKVPLWLGSIKSNIGHTQAAAGVAGVIKIAMAMRHGTLPKTLHVAEPTSTVDWTAGNVELLTEARAWPDHEAPRRAAVSSFGISGTNAHLILESAPQSQPAAGHALSGPMPFIVSARNAKALAAQAQRVSELLASADPGEVAYSLATTRALLEHTAVVIADDAPSACAALDRLASDGADAAVDGLVVGNLRSESRIVFVFPGQGGQWLGMAAELLDAAPEFAESMAECAAALSPFVDWDLFTVLRARAPLERVDVVQPALWAIMVSLARLWRAYGVEPAAVIGHSQGEIAAACTAGALSLTDGARVVALRSIAIAELVAPGGAMLSVALPVEQVRAMLVDRFAVLSVAAINGATSVVVSGEATAIDELFATLDAAGTRVKRIPVDYASHSAQVEVVRDRLRADLATIAPRTAEVPFYSTVTGGPFDTSGLDADYWYTNLRETVRFEPAVRALIDVGYGVFVECSPHPMLMHAVEETADAVRSEVTVVGSLRRNDGGVLRWLTSVAEAYTHGVPIDWTPVFASESRAGVSTVPRLIDLPTYPFQRERFWLGRSRSAGDLSVAGLLAAHHPLLGAIVSVADDGAVLFTGRLSTVTAPWLLDHAIDDTPLLPGTAFVELAIAVGDHLGCGRVEELTLEAPLLFSGAAVELQVRVGPRASTHPVGSADCRPPVERSNRTLSVHARPAGTADEWTRHASGLLALDTGGPTFDLVSWPPAGARPVRLDDGYERLARQGYHYGPAFQCLRAVWRTDEEVFAEVDLDLDADGFGIHPALFDSALHAAALADTDGPAQLPFSWSGVSLYRSAATSLRIRIRGIGTDTLSMELADSAGAPVASVDTLVSRPIESGSLAFPFTSDALFRVDWPMLPGGLGVAADHALITAAGLGAIDPATRFVVLSAAGSGDPVAATRDVVTLVMRTVQQWISVPRPVESRLVVWTVGAVSVGGEAVEDLAGAAVWGLVRAAQAENPDQIVLVDTAAAAVPAEVAAAAASGEPQVAVRAGVARVPRLVGARILADSSAGWGEGTVLLTGGTGVLGTLIARHLVAAHGVSNLLLVSRSGVTDEDFSDLDASVTVARCDVADRGELAALLATIPTAHPLTAVVHLAGALDDGLVSTLTAERLDAVLRPKVDAAWHLHELTAELDLSAFILFSSAAGTVDAAGQAGYAASNAFLDGLAQHRRSLGLPALALAWGFWEQRTGMTAHLSDADLAAMARGGVRPLTTAQGLALFDAALDSTAPVLVPIGLDRASLDRSAVLPAVLRAAPVRSVRPSAASASAADSVRDKLSALPAAQRSAALLEIVYTYVGAVLGHGDEMEFDPRRAFRDWGFDSLTAVELRNRLSAVVGVRLPATLVFDYPNPLALVDFLDAELVGAGPSPEQAGSAVAGSAVAEPIAIVAMSCRYPGGVDSPEALWQLVADDRDAISDFPADRGWDLESLYDPEPGKAGKISTHRGGFLHDAADFDADFFGIGPREALAMDPQQRLLLETSWEAVERAGIDPQSLRGSRTGVFTGLMYHDYGSRLSNAPEAVRDYLGNGSLGSVASGRVAYTLGLEGPTLTVDTACSSSLVAIHLAAQALRHGECSLALAGGVSVMSTPDTFVDFSRQQNLAADGRCRAFADGANGTTLSEGVGMVLLERLSDARRHGRRVLGVVAGSAVN